jgi:uncharacterized HAD superfamily protein
MTKEKSRFDEYLLQEYSVISEAHFKTIDSISSFFKNYLILMAIPITLLGSVLGLKNTVLLNQSSNQVSDQMYFYACNILIVISLIGMLLFFYIANLRFDAILYARTINGIRKYFYDSSELDSKLIYKIRVLPQSSFVPTYNEWGYFSPILLTFSFFNSIYFGLGILFLKPCVVDICRIFHYSKSLIVLFFSIHFIYYFRSAYNRENKYLKSRNIGIDIDGVLNKHREHFCGILEEVTSKKINPDDITHIPVHEGELGITKEESNKVFNNPKYWMDMPVNDNVSEVLNKLKNSFNYKIYIFTYRDWPIINNLESSEKDRIKSEWKKNLKIIEFKITNIRLFILSFINYNKYAINYMTGVWLIKNNISYNKLIIEKGNEHQAAPRSNLKNRFQVSRKKKIKFFIEDDLDKAINLSFICDFVFLIKQPYNNCDNMPSNIIVVNDWNDLYKNIKKLV